MVTDVLARAEQHRPGLRVSERRVADLVLAEPSVVTGLTIAQLAERTEVSVATIVRFCHALGYRGYAEFRRELAATLGRQSSDLDKFGVSDSDVGPDDDARDVVAKIALQEARAIQETLAAVDTATLDAVATAIGTAPRIDIYGSASSALAGKDLHQKLHRIGLISFQWDDPHLALTSAAVLPPNSVAIGISHSGLTVETSQALALARESGAVTVAISNFPESPIARQADYVLSTVTRESRYRSGAMSGRMAQLALVDVIFVRVAQRMYDRVTGVLEATYRAVQTHRLPFADSGK